MANSKQKGSEWERKFCKELSLWWTDQKKDDVFWRTSQSGGRATSRHREGKRTEGQYGDITYTQPEGKPLIDLFCFELKKGYPSSLFDLFESQSKQWTDWIKKAMKGNEQAGSLLPAIVSKRDYRNTIVTFVNDRPLYTNVFIKSLKMNLPFSTPTNEIVVKGIPHLFSIHMEDFLSVDTLAVIRERFLSKTTRKMRRKRKNTRTY